MITKILCRTPSPLHVAISVGSRSRDGGKRSHSLLQSCSAGRSSVTASVLLSIITGLVGHFHIKNSESSKIFLEHSFLENGKVR